MRGPEKVPMHFNFPFTVVQVLWTMTFAAQLVMLVVLLGRDRARRYPWFTASIVLFALSLLTAEVLTGRLPKVPLQWVLGILSVLTAIMGLLVVVEMARRAFDGVQWRIWIAWTVALLAVAGCALAFMGPWPARKDLTWDSALAVLRLIHLLAQKADLLVHLLTLELGLLVIIFGSRFKAGWKTHTQRIVIGLSTFAISSLAVQVAIQNIVKSAQPHSRAEYEHIIGQLGKLVNANGTVYLVVLAWWIVCLWMNEQGTAQAGEAAPELIESSLQDEPPQADE
jgi:hypothetical protein